MAKINSAPAAVQALTRQARLYLHQQGIKASSTFVNYNSKKHAMRIKLYGTAADTAILQALGFTLQVARGRRSATVYIGENGVIMPKNPPAAPQVAPAPKRSTPAAGYFTATELEYLQDLLAIANKSAKYDGDGQGVIVTAGIMRKLGL